ncbi:MAG: alpha/beta hydrolase [Actinobacteria bacterium]|nr:alpha/beta hydrolase [Actinomycetota bacterium]MCL6105074.1 alpha/beta hydrolase [Actinomycetota bacterium]
METTKQITTKDGAHIAVYDLGGIGQKGQIQPFDKPPLLFAHPTGMCGMMFEPLARRLNKYFHCITFDLRSHGDSIPPKGWDYNWDGFALDILGIIDALSLFQPYAVGHSCGGASLLSAEQTRPGTFKALWCFEPIIFPFDEVFPPHYDNQLSISAKKRRTTFNSEQEAFANYSSKPPFSTFDTDVLHAYINHGFVDTPHGKIKLKCNPLDESEIYAHAVSHNTYSKLWQVRAPVTLVCGENTDVFKADVLQLLADRLQHSRVEVMKNVGHFGPFEDTQATAQSILSAFG